MATYTEIHLRRDSTLNWYASNPRLALGEPGVDLTLHRFKIGNGIDRWNELPYMDDDLYKLLDKQQQETADKVRDLLNQIAANKLDADTKHNALTTELRNTSRELDMRMTAVEEEQAEYEESLTGEFTETKAEVHAGLEEFNETREQLTARMDVIAGEATEDTEILDARVDALSQTHPNLGANLRNIHSEVLSNQAQIAGLKANDELFGEELTGQVDRDEKLAAHGEFLQEQIDQNAEGVLNVGAVLSEEIKHSKEQDDALLILGEYLAAEVKTRGELRDDFTHEVESFRTSDEHLQEQSDDNAQAVLQTASTIQKLSTQSRVELEHEAHMRAVSDEHLQEQSDDNAQAILNITTALHNGSYLEGAIAGQKSPVNWSSAKSLAIPEPRCAVVNFTGLDAMPTSKTADIPAVMEFWDMQGNYFKKNVVLNAQGFTTLSFPKKNVKVDLLNDDESEFDLKIGNWVAQDGFHLKAFYGDFFRGMEVVGYRFLDEILRFNGLDRDRPYKRILLADNPKDITLQIDTGALCHPDGFPCVVYLNSKFYGVFSWELKKNRKNYHQEKSNVTHIHLDGGMYPSSIWNGVVSWTAFEIRNPNKLYTMDGKKYDGDAPRELIDETSEKYDPDNKNHVRSAKVKRYIQGLADNFQKFKSTYAKYRTSDPARVRAEYETFIDWESVRDYLIFGDVARNEDGTNGWNAQWTTYDGVKWSMNVYDIDRIFGNTWQSSRVAPPITAHYSTDLNLPMGYIYTLYNTELEARYKELRDAGIISVSNILDKLVDWTSRVGTDNYELEYECWPDSPCLVNYTDSLHRVKKWLETDIAIMDRIYHYKPLTLADIQENQESLTSSTYEATYEATASLSRLRQIYVEGLQEQIDILADLELQTIFTAKEERERLALRISLIEEALEENGISIPSASIMTDTEVNNMIDNVLNGSDKSGATPQSEDDAEIYNMLDDVFNGTDTGSYEDEVTKDLDTIFNP